MMPGADGPDAHGVGRLVAAAGHDRRARHAGRSPRPPPPITVPVDRRALVRRRQPARDRSRARRATSADQSRRGQVEQRACPAPSALSMRVLAGQPQPHVVLGQQDVARSRAQISGSCSRTHTSLGAVNPVSASLPVISISRSRPTRLADLVALRRPVRWSFHRMAGRRTASSLVEQHQAVHLAGEADGGDVDAGHARCQRQHGPDRGHGPVPPQRRDPARSRAAAGCRSRTRPCRSRDRAGRVDQDRLGGGRRDVDAEDVSAIGRSAVRLTRCAG